MEDLTIEMLLLNIIQYLLVLFFCKYVLDLNWSKKEFLFIVFIGFLPAISLFRFIGTISILYYLAIVAIMVYRETKVISHIAHVFMALILLVIGDNLYLYTGFSFTSRNRK